jgi:hypothetical protein
MIFICRRIPQYTQRFTIFLACNFILLVIKSCIRPMTDCSVRNMCYLDWGKIYVVFYCSLLSFHCKSITATKSSSLFSTTFSASLTNLTVLLPQSRDSSCYVSRTVLALPPLWLHKHSDLRAQIFAHSHEWSHDFGSSLPAPEAGDFVELLLLHQTEDIRHVYHLSFIKHTAATLKAVMCDRLLY